MTQHVCFSHQRPTSLACIEAVIRSPEIYRYYLYRHRDLLNFSGGIVYLLGVIIFGVVLTTLFKSNLEYHRSDIRANVTASSL